MSAAPSPSPCVRRLIDAHFAGTIVPRDERTLRAHLPDCDACRAYYERHLIVASLDPRALDAEARIASGLGLRPRRHAARAWPVAMGAAAAAAAMVVLHLRPHQDDGFTARGVLAPQSPSFFAYRVDPAQKLDPAGATIHATEDLAFAYTNPSGYRHLLVYGVDEHRHVYWYYPAWSDPSDDPHAIAVDPGLVLRELPEAIRHEIDGHQLTIHAVFLDHDTSVRQVERWVSEARTPNEPLPGAAYEERVALEVEH